MNEGGVCTVLDIIDNVMVVFEVDSRLTFDSTSSRSGSASRPRHPLLQFFHSHGLAAKRTSVISLKQ